MAKPRARHAAPARRRTYSFTSRLPRGRRAWMVTGMVAALVIVGAMIVLASGTSYDLINNESVTVNDGALFQYFDTEFADGTGNLKPFVRIQGNPNEAGYNSEDEEFETGQGKWTHPILLSEIPSIDVAGTNYREFIGDFNEANSGPNAQISIDAFEIYLFDESDVGFDPKVITDYPYGREGYNHGGPYSADPTWGVPAWYLDGHVLATEENSHGSGQGDVQILVPDSQLSGHPECYYGSTICDTYLVNFVAMGFFDEDPPDGVSADNWGTGATFEEIAVREYPILDMSKTLDITYEEEIDWTISKEVTPPSADRFIGESAGFDYRVTLLKATEMVNYRADGEITFSNNSGVDLYVASIVDTFNAGSVTVTCPATPFLVPDGDSVVCSYTADLGDDPVMPPGGWQNLAEAGYYQLVDNDGALEPGPTLNRFAEATDDTPSSRGTSAGSEPATVTVSDTLAGDLGSFANSGDTTYRLSQSCSTNPADYAADGTWSKDYPNTASINETTGDSDSKTVTLNCYAPTVTKDALTYFNRDWDWKITKDYDGDYDLFAGESVSHGYKVSVEPTFSDDGWGVKGTITIANGHPTGDMTLTSVSDLAGGISATVICPSLVVPSGGTLKCTYDTGAQTPYPDSNPFGDTNTATAVFAGLDWTGEADIVFGSDPTTEDEPVITVDDSNLTGESWTADRSSEDWTYSRDFACPRDASLYVNGVYALASHVNTATINETGQSDTATVDVTCYLPTVSKDATTSYTRDWDWTIEKQGDASSLILSEGQLYQVSYRVTVNATYSDSGYAVKGTITVNNPHPDEDMDVIVSDVVSPDIVATLECGGTLTVPAGGSATCDYSTQLPDGTDRVNTVTVTMDGIDTTATADVIFGDPTTETDECITVNDDQYGALGTVCATDLLPKTFTYSMEVGGYAVCGMYQFTNVADFVTNDNGDTGSATWTVIIDVPCPTGCTLTPGYWKTHSEYGPAPYDDAWADLGDADGDLSPEGQDEGFFHSGQTYYEVLWTVPKGGDAYYILAHAYIAAEMNVVNGAYMPDEVQEVFDLATAWFDDSSNTPGGKFTGKAGAEERHMILGWADLLDSYNNGFEGTPHCDEDESSAP